MPNNNDILVPATAAAAAINATAAGQPPPQQRRRILSDPIRTDELQINATSTAAAAAAAAATMANQHPGQEGRGGRIVIGVDVTKDNAAGTRDTRRRKTSLTKKQKLAVAMTEEEQLAERRLSSDQKRTLDRLRKLGSHEIDRAVGLIEIPVVFQPERRTDPGGDGGSRCSGRSSSTTGSSRS